MHSQSIYPIDDNLPEFDKNIEKLSVNDDPKQSSDNPLVYAYDISAVPLEDDVLEENLVRIA